MSEEQPCYIGDKTADRLLEALRFVETDPRYRVQQSRNEPIPNNEPELMIALADFAPVANASSGATYGADRDALVALCVNMERPENVDIGVERSGIVSPMSVFPVAGREAVPVYDSLGGRSGNVAGCTARSIKCGSRLWVIFNPWTRRYEVVSTDADFPGGASCDCSWGGWATWRVVDDGGPAWELAENHCVGCSADLSAAQDLRFGLTTDETSLIEPTLDPPESWIGTDRRYVTCCGGTDVPPECPSCCYSISVPVPACGGGIAGSVQLVLSGGGGGINCAWSSGDFIAAITGLECSEWTTTSTRNITVRAMLFEATNYLFVYVRFATPDGETTVQARYVVSGTIDCSTSLTASLDTTTTIGSGTWECTECPLAIDDFFPATLDITLASSCDTTTQSTTTGSTTTTTGSTTTTTTGSTTTTTTESTTTTTTQSTTTGSTTSGSTTTTTTTTGSSTTTTTAPPCTGDCNYIAVSGTSPTGFVWSGNGNNCSGSGCGCPSELQTPIDMLGYPTFEGQTGSIPCATNYP